MDCVQFSISGKDSGSCDLKLNFPKVKYFTAQKNGAILNGKLHFLCSVSSRLAITTSEKRENIVVKS